MKILNIEIDFDTSILGKIIQLRHDIVHRNGKSKNGEEINIDNEDLAEKVSEVAEYVKHINEKLLEIYVT